MLKLYTNYGLHELFLNSHDENLKTCLRRVWRHQRGNLNP